MFPLANVFADTQEIPWHSAHKLHQLLLLLVELTPFQQLLQLEIPAQEILVVLIRIVEMLVIVQFVVVYLDIKAILTVDVDVENVNQILNVHLIKFVKTFIALIHVLPLVESMQIAM